MRHSKPLIWKRRMPNSAIATCCEYHYGDGQQFAHRKAFTACEWLVAAALYSLTRVSDLIWVVYGSSDVRVMSVLVILVEYCFTSRHRNHRLIRDRGAQDGHLSRLSHNSWALVDNSNGVCVCVCRLGEENVYGCVCIWVSWGRWVRGICLLL